MLPRSALPHSSLPVRPRAHQRPPSPHNPRGSAQHAGRAPHSDALFTAWTRKEVTEINAAAALAACNRRGNATFTIWATHTAPRLRGGGRGGRGGCRRPRGAVAAAAPGGDSDDDNDGAPAPRDAEAALASARSEVIDPLVLNRLMRYNPNISDDGKQIDGPGFRPPPFTRLAVGSCVRLAITDSVILGLTKGAQGSVFGFYFARDGPAPVPNASLRSLADAGRNPPWGVPIVLVQWAGTSASIVGSRSSRGSPG